MKTYMRRIWETDDDKVTLVSLSENGTILCHRYTMTRAQAVEMVMALREAIEVSGPMSSLEVTAAANAIRMPGA